MASDNKAAAQARRQAIAKLVQTKVMTHQEAGQHIEEGLDPKKKAIIPNYDIAKIQASFPNILMIVIEEDINDVTKKSCGFYMLFHDGADDTPEQGVRIELGAVLPKTAEELIEKIKVHFRSLIKMDKLQQAADAFAGFEDDE